MQGPVGGPLTYGIARRVLGVRVVPLIAAYLWANIRLVGAVGMALDGLFFPKLRTTRSRSRSSSSGNPRTGTTFLQRFLADQGYGAGMEVFRMLHPSLLVQAILQPFLPILEAVSPARYHSTKAHDTSLASRSRPTTWACCSATSTASSCTGSSSPSTSRTTRASSSPRSATPPRATSPGSRRSGSGASWPTTHDTVIAKLFSLGTRLPQFLKSFPDARILYMARDPLATIPSGMSLVTGVLDNAFGFWKLPEDVRNRWIERLYNGLVELQRRFHDDYVSGRIPKDQVYVVRYDRMMSDFEGLMDDMHAVPRRRRPTEAQRKAIAEQAEKQRSYKSEHAYDLAKFGLDEARIRGTSTSPGSLHRRGGSRRRLCGNPSRPGQRVAGVGGRAGLAGVVDK